ncbi:hypothetical protein [Hydrogenophaga sp.]|mgnify:CR=1 FL=1|uniref:hypothetical protein n=1 Tax=Hydrogenophaga sp. TaxID=1904254 RepID=UPI00286D7791|nr:hypothetical protein [Hydrogenophaga sp.]
MKPLQGSAVGLFTFEPERLQGVVAALEKGDISECRALDVAHAAKVLRAVLLTDQLAPRAIQGFFDVGLPTLMMARVHEAEEQQAQEAADAMGWGEALSMVREARDRPNQRGLVEAMVNMAMLKTQGNRSKALEMVADYMGRDVESVRRSMNRAKSRKK